MCRTLLVSCLPLFRIPVLFREALCWAKNWLPRRSGSKEAFVTCRQGQRYMPVKSLLFFNKKSTAFPEALSRRLLLISQRPKPYIHPRLPSPHHSQLPTPTNLHSPIHPSLQSLFCISTTMAIPPGYTLSCFQLSPPSNPFSTKLSEGLKN